MGFAGACYEGYCREHTQHRAMATSGATQHGKHAVKFQEFSTAHAVISRPTTHAVTLSNGFDLVLHSVRVQEARSREHSTNSKKAKLRAAKLQRSVKTDLALDLQVADEVIEIASDDENAERQEPPPMPLPMSVQRNEKAVRFSDAVDTEQFHFVPTQQCELFSTHELYLNALVSRVAAAKVSPSPASDETKALDRGFLLQTEVEFQRKVEDIVGGDMTTMCEEDLWLDVEEEIGETAFLASRHRKKQIKRCFWNLDTGRMPEEVQDNCVSKRWQDHVR
eukprot:TRINITY_DN17078_c0_g2_i1.p2 TRINITY_DN17078_c0_g2~~TRINITY_DN17078_c0_g2_i1.p2  ORF type:complete len:279 (+),score=54.95 TRINITY_DN17078_c0_g2_i1:670-1506(+)